MKTEAIVARARRSASGLLRSLIPAPDYRDLRAAAEICAETDGIDHNDPKTLGIYVDTWMRTVEPFLESSSTNGQRAAGAGQCEHRP